MQVHLLSGANVEDYEFCYEPVSPETQKEHAKVRGHLPSTRHRAVTVPGLGHLPLCTLVLHEQSSSTSSYKMIKSTLSSNRANLYDPESADQILLSGGPITSVSQALDFIFRTR